MTNENIENDETILETFPKTEPVIEISGTIETGLAPAEHTETKATIDGVWIVDGRLAICTTEHAAIKLYEDCFKIKTTAVPSDRFPAPGEKVLHLRDGIPVYGRPE